MKVSMEPSTEGLFNSLDRGGLWHVNDTAYIACSLFYALEDEIKSFFTVTPIAASKLDEQMSLHGEFYQPNTRKEMVVKVPPKMR